MSSVAEVFLLAWQHHQNGGFARAEHLYRQVLQADPTHADAWCFFGAACQSQGKLADAEYGFRRAVQLLPHHASAHNCLGVLLAQGGKLAEAVASFRLARRARPENVEIQNNLGLALARNGQLDEAIECYGSALQLKPDYAIAHYNLGLALRAMGRHQAAIASFQQALRLHPNYPEVLNDLGNIYWEQGRFDEAMACLCQSLTIAPDFALAHWSRSLLRLTLGNFAEGWAEYEWRWDQPGFTRRSFSQPMWDGSPLDGRTIFLHVEQGFGDVFQFIRYLELIKDRRGKPVVECHPQLVRVLAGVVGMERLIPLGSPLPRFDVYSPLLSLPRLFHTTLATVPGPVPYLRPDTNLVEQWRHELSKCEVRGSNSDVNSIGSNIAPRSTSARRFRIGIAWQGSPTHVADRRRSIPLTKFAPLTCIPGIRIISLQKGAGLEQLSENRQLTTDDYSLDEAAGPFMDTAAIMHQLDLVICSDSAVAHLAGAMAIPVWLPLPFVPDWRWLLEREDCPWYPTMRLFRQKQSGAWEDVFQDIAAELKQLVSMNSSVQIVVS